MADINHINHSIYPRAHTSMYVWHKYWARKTWNVVGEYIETYCSKDCIVLDPFSGSGVVGIEAVKRGRRAISIDLNPAACNIQRITLSPVDLQTLFNIFKDIEAYVKRDIENLYLTKCKHCGKNIVPKAFVHNLIDDTIEYRLRKCPHCEEVCASGCLLDNDDLSRLDTINKTKIEYWYPDLEMIYPNGKPFVKREHYKKISDLFTHRNLLAVAMLYDAINSLNPRYRKFFMAAFTSMIHLTTRMMPVCEPSPTHHSTPYSSPGWTTHSFVHASRYFMEQNVWDKFRSSIIGHQGLINGLSDAQRTIAGVRISDSWIDVFDGKADIAIVQGDSISELKAFPQCSVDYCFTDPPYVNSIQYGELSLLWNSWLKTDPDYINSIYAQEIIENDNQGKDQETYFSLLANTFRDLYRILKPDAFLTLTFHNPTFNVRDSLIKNVRYSGFNFEKIHHQPSARFSAKSLL